MHSTSPMAEPFPWSKGGGSTCLPSPAAFDIGTFRKASGFVWQVTGSREKLKGKDMFVRYWQAIERNADAANTRLEDDTPLVDILDGVALHLNPRTATGYEAVYRDAQGCPAEPEKKYHAWAAGRSLGYFSTAVEAAKAYAKYKKTLDRSSRKRGRSEIREALAASRTAKALAASRTARKEEEEAEEAEPAPAPAPSKEPIVVDLEEDEKAARGSESAGSPSAGPSSPRSPLTVMQRVRIIADELELHDLLPVVPKVLHEANMRMAMTPSPGCSALDQADAILAALGK